MEERDYKCFCIMYPVDDIQEGVNPRVFKKYKERLWNIICQIDVAGDIDKIGDFDGLAFLGKWNKTQCVIEDIYGPIQKTKI